MKTSQTGMFFDYYHRRDEVTRVAAYERKKVLLRERLARWPQLPPDDLADLPQSVQWWWRTLHSLRDEISRAQRGLSIQRTIHTPRRVRAALIHLKRTA